MVEIGIFPIISIITNKNLRGPGPQTFGFLTNSRAVFMEARKECVTLAKPAKHKNRC